ncbi:hypothetical protein [Pedobacter frigoris]|uniref:Sulfatase N-terminal domain-containing protein n=1 Tax=Pedobacter frigoris TaxID=2571272 RepID=A0A4U1CNB1_9SPHI|nr:hypothetical protein [Pedobacter frigoris]TKC09411.1 hypothetical protein FA047_04775 [Pedobacter frigoris]
MKRIVNYACLLLVFVLTSFSGKKDKKINIVFIGDSITEGGALAHPETGHASNYRITTQMYMDSVKWADARVGRILTALKARSTYDNEDWLIVVSTDHGGDLGHGGSSYPERNAFIILNKI